jgi:hypothetical protein
MISARFEVFDTSVKGVFINVYDPFQPNHKGAFLEEI